MKARQAALNAITHVLKDGTYLNLELKKALMQNWTIEDKRFITALASTTIENLCRIDYVLEKFIGKKRVHTVIRNILRLGACQLMFFESVPVSAAVNESVKLVQDAGKPQLKGFVNAVLRNVSKTLGKIEYPDRKKDPVEFLHVFYSYPKWLCEQYLKDYGAEQAEQMLAYHGDNALTCVRFCEEDSSILPEGALPGKYLTDAAYLRHVSAIDKMPEFQDGMLTVQGEASMLCVRTAGIRQGDKVLDACAAPGGKSAYASQFVKDGRVVSMELHPHRATLIENTFARLHIENAEIVVADASEFQENWQNAFDVVLADVPCSALGLLYRKPDIKVFKEKEDIPSLVKTQRGILSTCARYVKKGGTLLYSTCTIDKAENEENVSWFLQNNPDFRGIDLAERLPEKLRPYAEGEKIQLFPFRDEIDGFFIAGMERV